MYKERMNEYYPQVIQAISEFQAIIDAEYPEFEELEKQNERVMSDAYLHTMTEARVKEWENMLGIHPIAGSSVDDRRDTIIARIRGQGKLNTKLINSIVNAFTGGTAKSYVKDSVLYVEITPPPDDKHYRFENVESELANKVPAHLGLMVSRNYTHWEDFVEATWGDIADGFNYWEEILIYNPFD